jgi:hypothetical protein
MSLRIRRGTDAQRTGVTFLEGELVYTTDTKKLYLGDGTTAGGIAVDSTTGSISQLADVNINGIQTGQILQWDGAQFIAGDDAGDQDSIFGADSTLLVDATNSSINLDGTVKGHIIPDQNETYNLGSASNKFNDLFLSGTTITLGTATISSDGSEITLSQPINATVKSTGDVDTNDNSITNTAAGGNITIAPTAGKKLLVNDTVGGTSFAVDTTAKSIDIDNGYGLKLATFGSADYSALVAQSGQIVFDNPTKGLKIYNGTDWVTVAGGAGGAGVVEGQTYDININGDIVGDDSTLLINTQTKDLSLLTGAFTGVLQAGTLNADAINGTTVTTTGLGTFSSASVGTNLTVSSLVTTNNLTSTGISTLNIVNATTINGDIFGSVTGDAHITGTITAEDSSVFFDADTRDINIRNATSNTINAGRVNATEMFGSLVGSVFDESSTVMVDAINSTFQGTSATLDSVSTPIIDSPDGTLTTNAVGANPAIMKYNRSAASAYALTQSIGRQLISKTIAGTETIVGSHSMSEDTFNWLHAPGGTYNYDNYVIFHKTGKVAISMGQANISAEPAAHLEVGGNIKMDGSLIGGVQAISGAGAIDVTTLHTEITTTGADAYTLANGVAGQLKIISMKVDGGDGTLTPTTLANGTTITFNDVNDSVTMIYSSLGWLPLAVQGAVIA